MDQQTIPSDAPSEYMRGYSDGLEQGRRGFFARVWLRIIVAARGCW